MTLYLLYYDRNHSKIEKRELRFMQECFLFLNDLFQRSTWIKSVSWKACEVGEKKKIGSSFIDWPLYAATFEEVVRRSVRRCSLICHVPARHATSALMSATKFTTILNPLRLWPFRIYPLPRHDRDNFGYILRRELFLNASRACVQRIAFLIFKFDLNMPLRPRGWFPW